MLQRAARAKAKQLERSVGEEDVADAVGGLGGGGFGGVEGGEAAVGAERDGGVFVGGNAGGVRHVRRAVRAHLATSGAGAGIIRGVRPDDAAFSGAEAHVANFESALGGATGGAGANHERNVA